MTTDPQQIRVRVDAVLAEIPSGGPSATGDIDTGDIDTGDIDTGDIDTVGRRLEEAHQILVDALESVEKS